jgi:DNA-binding XRE family transcriptional regulator
MSAKDEGRRIIRDRYLTPEEVAQDNDVRQKVMEEFPPKNPNVKIGKKLREVRERQGLTPEQLAQKAGLSDATIREAEQGREIPLSTFVHLADALGCQLTLSHH